MAGTQFPLLSEFLGGYFHQDFMIDYGSPQQAITMYRSEASRQDIEASRGEIHRLLSVISQIDDPENFLWKELGCYYSPKTDGLSVHDWLVQLEIMLRG